MRLPLPRFCRAVTEWLRQNIDNGTEKGQQQWETLITWVNTPPAAPLRAVATTTRPLSTAAAMRAQAEAAVGREDAAFAAFAGTAGR